MKTDLEKYWQAYCEGDQRAFENVFTMLFDPLFFKVMTLTEDRDTAKDIVQEALIKLYQYHEPSSIRDIKSWTFRVAKNLFISEYRKVQTQRKYQQHILEENQDFSHTPTSFHDKDNLMRLLKKNLSATDFQLLQLEMNGYPIPEIASKMKMQQKTVYNRRTNIRKFVGQVWKQLFFLLIMINI